MHHPSFPKPIASPIFNLPAGKNPILHPAGGLHNLDFIDGSPGVQFNKLFVSTSSNRKSESPFQNLSRPPPASSQVWRSWWVLLHRGSGSEVARLADRERLDWSSVGVIC